MAAHDGRHPSRLRQAQELGGDATVEAALRAVGVGMGSDGRAGETGEEGPAGAEQVGIATGAAVGIATGAAAPPIGIATATGPVRRLTPGCWSMARKGLRARRRRLP